MGKFLLVGLFASTSLLAGWGYSSEQACAGFAEIFGKQLDAALALELEDAKPEGHFESRILEACNSNIGKCERKEKKKVKAWVKCISKSNYLTELEHLVANNANEESLDSDATVYTFSVLQGAYNQKCPTLDDTAQECLSGLVPADIME